MRLISELRRRNVFRMTVLYAVAAWLIMQVAGVLIDLAKLPDWIGTTILWLLAVGFPIALIFSWFYEITPEGISLEKDIAPGESITHVTGRRLDFLVISLLCAAVILFAYDKWWTSGPPEHSIAVLAFENMSDDPGQEYFSDGISEELLNLLAKIPELSVISRTSAFSYKGKGVRLSEIARELNVAHVLEGSVRKVGNKVRVTAQLIEADSDTHLWSQTYDRTINDIFLIQDQIAAEVVDQLKITLLDDVPVVQKIDPDGYALYLRARHLGRQGTREAWEQSIALFEQVLAVAPEYAAAWDGLANVYISQTNNSQRPIDDGYALAREAATQALALDPTYGSAHARLGWISMHHDGDLEVAADYYERALALAPTNTTIIFGAASLAMTLDRIDTAIALENYATVHDPLYPVGHNNLGDSYLSAGKLDQAIASFRTALTLSPGYVGAQYRIGVALLLNGEPKLALSAMQLESFQAWRLLGLAMAYHALGQIDESDVALADMIEKYEQDAAYNIAYVLAFRGDTDLAFEWLQKAVLYNDPGLAEIANEPLFGNIKKDTRWLPFLDSIGKSPRQLHAIEFNVTLPD
jgi:TolB-like protein/Tfp pilus assembly protein PilF